jgi:hypothetical protein
MPPKAQKEPATEVNEERVDEVQLGDGGAREAEVSAAQAEFDAMSEAIDLGEDGGKVVASATLWVIELFKRRPKAWDQLSQAEQRDLASGIEHNVKELVRHVVEAVARQGRDPVRCLLVGFTDKGDDIKVELKVKAFTPEENEAAVLGLHRARGKHVLVTVASADDFHDEPARDESEPDQRPLEFESGTDEHPSDDSDLARPPSLAEGEDVDLKTSMVVALDHDGETTVDVRDASPEELAWKRESTADFAAAEQSEAETVEA